MRIAVTGATGHLGRLVIDALLERGVPAGQVVAVVRDTVEAGELATRGVQVRHGNYDQPDTLATALAGTDKVLLVSGSEVGRRIVQHRAVVDAAAAAGVGLLAYTSIPKADTTPLLLAAEHRATEELIRASGLRYTFMRNSFYLEVYTAQLPTYLEHGAIVGAAGDGRVSAATRGDYAAAAAAVLTGDGHDGAVYELGGDDAFTMTELAAVVSAHTGRDILYRDLPVEEYTRVLTGAGLPEPLAAVVADSDAGVARGDLLVTAGDLSRLIGRPATPYTDAVAAAVAELPAGPTSTSATGSAGFLILTGIAWASRATRRSATRRAARGRTALATRRLLALMSSRSSTLLPAPPGVLSRDASRLTGTPQFRRVERSTVMPQCSAVISSASDSAQVIATWHRHAAEPTSPPPHTRHPRSPPGSPPTTARRARPRRLTP